MASTDARPVPRKNAAFRVYFPLFDADGDLVSGASGLDSEVSKDGGSVTDCANEATEIGSSGLYYLDLTSTEMDADSVVVIVKTSTSGAKTTPIVLYPEEVGDYRVNVEQFGGSNLTATGGRPEVNASHWGGTAVGSANVLIDNAITAAKIAADAITAGKIAADAIGAPALAADAVSEIQSGLATSSALAIVAGYVDTEIASILADLATLLSRLSSARAGYLDHLDGIKATTDKIDDTLENDGGTFRFTSNALEEAPSGGGGSTDWTSDERTAIRAILGIPGSGTTPADPSAGILDTIRDSVATRASQTSVDDLPKNAELASALASADDAILAAIAALNNVSAAQVNAQVDQAISDAALATAANLSAAKAVIDAIKPKTDKLTFNANNEVASNVESINDISMDGTGVIGDGWRPAP